MTKRIFGKLKLKITWPLLLLNIPAFICSNDYKLDARKGEIEKLEKEIFGRKKLFILSGPKHIGKSFLVQHISEKHPNVFLLDLRAKSTDEQIKETIIDSIIRFSIKNFNTAPGERTKDSVPGVSIERENLTIPDEMAQSRSIKETEKQYVPNSSDAIKKIIQILHKSLLSESNDLCRPSCVIIDEAQTLKHLNPSDLRELIDYLIACGRKNALSILFVTSNYSALIATTGKFVILFIFIFIWILYWCKQ